MQSHNKTCQTESAAWCVVRVVIIKVEMFIFTSETSEKRKERVLSYHKQIIRDFKHHRFDNTE